MTHPATRRRRAFVDLLVAVEELREARLAEEAAERFGLDLSALPAQPSGESHDQHGRVIGRYQVTTDAAARHVGSVALSRARAERVGEEERVMAELWQLAARRVASSDETHTRSDRYSCRAIVRDGRARAYCNAFTAWIWLDRRNRKLAALEKRQ